MDVNALAMDAEFLSQTLMTMTMRRLRTKCWRLPEPRSTYRLSQDQWNWEHFPRHFLWEHFLSRVQTVRSATTATGADICGKSAGAG